MALPSGCRLGVGLRLGTGRAVGVSSPARFLDLVDPRSAAQGSVVGPVLELVSVLELEPVLELDVPG